MASDDKIIKWYNPHKIEEFYLEQLKKIGESLKSGGRILTDEQKNLIKVLVHLIFPTKVLKFNVNTNSKEYGEILLKIYYVITIYYREALKKENVIKLIKALSNSFISKESFPIEISNLVNQLLSEINKTNNIGKEPGE